MQRHPQRHYSVDDYFAVEAHSPIKHEYYQGEIFAAGAASVAHNDITANVVATLRLALRGTGFRAFGRDLRLVTPGGLYTYPDVMVVCGRVDLTLDRPDTVTNPVLLAEVLSEATRDYDRGEKFALYQAIPTLREYLLIEQDRIGVEHFQREEAEVWRSTAYNELGAVLPLISVPAQLPLSEIYREVFSPVA
jgi:Uma2 family endonuclease